MEGRQNSGTQDFRSVQSSKDPKPVGDQRNPNGNSNSRMTSSSYEQESPHQSVRGNPGGSSMWRAKDGKKLPHGSESVRDQRNPNGNSNSRMTSSPFEQESPHQSVMGNPGGSSMWRAKDCPSGKNLPHDSDSVGDQRNPNGNSNSRMTSSPFEQESPHQSVRGNPGGSSMWRAKDCPSRKKLPHDSDSDTRASGSASKLDSTSSDVSADNKCSIFGSPQDSSSSSAGRMAVHFDICPVLPKVPVKLHSSLYIMNKEKRKKHQNNLIEQVRPGMFLLKDYVSHIEQVKIVKRCQELGLGPGGFYQPGYRDGAKLHLQMMCLGKNWDPETRSYDDIRPIDGAKPPSIPDEFKKLVDQVIQASHSFIKENNSKVCSVEKVLPKMVPDLCIVNFYTIGGKLGFHQDRDETRESIAKGLPVVSFSFGDSAEFVYGDSRDVDNANKVVLNSGDVLVFGGESRHIFHGVTSISPHTAPELLVKETNLRPGRLNLTFRQH